MQAQKYSEKVQRRGWCHVKLLLPGELENELWGVSILQPDPWEAPSWLPPLFGLGPRSGKFRGPGVLFSTPPHILSHILLGLPKTATP